MGPTVAERSGTGYAGCWAKPLDQLHRDLHDFATDLDGFRILLADRFDEAGEYDGAYSVRALRDHEKFARAPRRTGETVPEPSLSVQTLDPP